MQRPKVVTIVAWFVIIYSLLFLFLKLFGLLSPVVRQHTFELMHHQGFSHSLSIAIIVLGLVSALWFLIVGIGLFNGKQWARWLWVIGVIAFNLIAMVCFWVIATNISSALTTGIIIQTILAIIGTVCLFMPKANAYFKHR